MKLQIYLFIKKNKCINNLIFPLIQNLFCVGQFIYKANIKAKRVNVILTQNKQLEGSHHVTEQNKETEEWRPEATGTHSESSVMELSLRAEMLHQLSMDFLEADLSP